MTANPIYKKASERAITNLAKRIESFRPNRKLHFYERMYRVTGQARFIPPLSSAFQELMRDFENKAKIAGDISKEKREGLEKLNLLKDLSPLKKIRWEYYEKHPEIKYYQSLIYLMLKISDYQVSKYLNSQGYKVAITRLGRIDWKKIFSDNDLLFFDPVQNINLAFWLKDLEITNITDSVIKSLKLLYPATKINTTSEFNFLNNIYAYTHILIADSGYYQKYPNNKEYCWVYEYFKSNRSYIFNSQNLDLIAETGVVFKLNPDYETELEGYKELIYQKVNEDTGLLDLNESKDALFEHANTLVIMLLAEWNGLFSGPKLTI